MKKAKLPIALLAIAAVIVLLAWSGVYRVGQGEEALVLTFGEVTGKEGPGIHWHIPIVQSVISESVSLSLYST